VPGQEKLVFLAEPPTLAASHQQSFPFEQAINAVSAKLDRIHSGQLTFCAQVKDIRESLPMQRRSLSRWV
jgi:hypothetical protein